MRILNLFTLCILVGLMSCNSEQNSINEGPFFSLKNYLETEVKSLGLVTVHQIVQVNEKKEETDLENFDLANGLEYLKEFDIDKPRFYDKYSVNDKDGTLSYTAIDEDMKVKNLVVKKEGNLVKEIIIQYKTKTIISTLEKEITFLPGQSLKIQNKTKAISRDPKNFDMIWTW